MSVELLRVVAPAWLHTCDCCGVQHLQRGEGDSPKRPPGWETWFDASDVVIGTFCPACVGSEIPRREGVYSVEMSTDHD